jgi:N-acetylneuraminic acid mutarotase
VNGKLYAVGGGDGSEAIVARNEAYTPGDVWVTKASMPTGLEAFAAAVVGGKLHTLGGRLNGSTYPQHLVYDPGANRWTGGALLPQPRAETNGAGVINGIVYLPGGHGDDGLYTKSLYAYNPSTNAWSSKAPMPAAIGCGGSGVISGKLYVYGTCGPDGTAKGGLYVYDAASNGWGSRISAPIRRFPAMAAVNGKLYLAGGQNEFGSPTTAASVYDPATHQWTSLPPMAVARYWAAVVVLNGRLYVVGGYDGIGPVTTVEVYEPATNRWRTVSGIPLAAWSLGAGAINGKVYAVGGMGEAPLAVNRVYIP